jgi:hypothetical protein
MKSINNLHFALMVMVIVSSSSIISFSQLDTSRSSWGGFFDIGLQHSNVKNEVSDLQGFPNAFSGLTLGLGIFHNFYLAGIKFSGELPQDRKPFTNYTNQGDKKSHVELMQFSIYAGGITPKINLTLEPNIFIVGHLSLGNMWAFGEERSINGCVDCDVEDLNLNGGLYIDPEVYFIYEFVGVGFGYRYFFKSDYINKLELKLSLFISD